MSDEMIKRIGQSMVTIELNVNAVNALLNALNMPSQTPTTIAADLLINIEKQVIPQVEKIRSTFEDRKSTRLNSSHSQQSRMPSSA